MDTEVEIQLSLQEIIEKKSIAIIKMAAAIVNKRNRDLAPKLSKYIIRAAEEIIKWKHEKHFTLNKDLPGRDNKFALLPNDLQKLAQFRSDFQFMNIDRGLDLQKCEMSTYKNYRGRWSK